jgi:hypothetical protein
MSISEKIHLQTLYIKDVLEKHAVCSIPTRGVNRISSVVVKDILVNKFNNGVSMNSILCLFDALLLDTHVYKNIGLYRLSLKYKKWIKKMDATAIKEKGENGLVYFSDIIHDIEVIIKRPINYTDYYEMVREYFIGITKINKLRYIIPNFVYTLGAFICPVKSGKMCVKDEKEPKIPFVIYEKIPGENMKHMLENSLISFPEYLGIFIQLLLALEVAQREMSFCHFDLHVGNVMCRKLDSICKYKVVLDMNTYEVSTNKYLPVIIDFGLSTIKHDDKIIGSYTFPEYGMMHYMIQGADIYKFLYSSITYASEKNVNEKIIGLMNFYGKDDPYKSMLFGYYIASTEYGKRAIFSNTASYTPMDFLSWILDNPEYSEIASQYIKKHERKIYIPLSYNTMIQEYDSMFLKFRNKKETENNLVINKTVDFVNICAKQNFSFIITNYLLHILDGYNQELKSEEINDNIKEITRFVNKNNKTMIDNDKNIINEYKNIKIPNQDFIKLDFIKILDITVDSELISNEQKKHIIGLLQSPIYNIFTDILPYLQIVYTIKEIKLENVYKHFLSSFLSSEQYKVYIENYKQFNRASRWATMLLDSLV